MIHFLLDSTSAIPESYLEQHENVHVVPLTISINQEYIPESDVTIEKVIECSERDKKTVPTRQPSTGDFLQAFSNVPEEDPVIVLCLTSAVSGTYNGAVLAARQSGRKNICVLDSRTTAIGMLQLLEDGIELAQSNLAFDEVCKKLFDLTFHMRTEFTVDTLDYLYRGGRIGKAASLIGGILKIRPVIYLNPNNEVDVLAKVRTEKKAIASMVKYLEENSPCKRIGVVHIENEEGGKSLQAKLQELYPENEVTLTTGTPVLASYLGPGLLGIIFESAK